MSLIGIFSLNLFAQSDYASQLYVQGIMEINRNNINGSLEKLQKACDMEHQGACSRLAGVLYQYKKKEVGNQKIKDLLVKACEKNDQEGCHNLGMFVYKEEKNPDEAIRYLHKSCIQGYSDSCRAIEQITKQKGGQTDEQKRTNK
ncbi:MAG: hypothetical protein ACPLW7_06285 [Minisyncoccia bacterium]